MYDYVIVGAGSAGCVLANRLSEDPDVTVLLVEAGPSDRNDFIHIPAAMGALFKTSVDWDFSTGWEPGANNRRIFLPRGKMLGGSSSINAMVYIRGTRHDWDEWAAAGCDGWSWDAILPYYKRAEGNVRGADDLHGADGPLTVSEGYRNPLCEAFVDAAVASGMPLNQDFNGPEQDGAGWYQTTTRAGKRCSTAAAYLHPVADRANLTVQTWCHVTRVLFEGSRAVGIEALRLDEILEFRATREVILCGGSYQSPQLLTLSGIGRPDELELLQVPLVAESPEVGLNLSDHPTSGFQWTCHDDISLKDALNDDNLAAWAQGEGWLTCTPAPAGGFLRTRDGLHTPDVQFHAVPALFEQEGTLPPPEHGFTLGACVLRPRSRGQVAITSPDPTAKPYIVHAYLTDEEDVAAMVAGTRKAMEIAATSPLADLLKDVHLGPASDSDADIEAHVRATMQTIYHPVGTCAMGTVVDTECRVNGTEGLRVIDASVFPSTPRGNTNAPTIALAERASDLIAGKTPLSASAAEPAASLP